MTNACRSDLGMTATNKPALIYGGTCITSFSIIN